VKRLLPAMLVLTLGSAVPTLVPAADAAVQAKPSTAAPATTVKPSDKPAAQPATAAPSTPVPAANGEIQPGSIQAIPKPDSLVKLEKAVAKDSSNFNNLYRLGVAYLDHDDVSSAVKVLSKAHQIKPKDIKTLVNLGAASDAAGKSLDAQNYYRSALKIAPDDSVASCRLASSLYAQGRYDESMDLLRDVITKKPGSYCAYFTLGVAFADAGIYRDAIRMWQKVVTLAPTSPEAVSAKESIDVLEKFVSQK